MQNEFGKELRNGLLSFACTIGERKIEEQSSGSAIGEISTQGLNLESRWDQLEDGVWKWTLCSKGQIAIDWSKLAYKFDIQSVKIKKVLCNGFQSWTETRPFYRDEKMRALRTVAEPLMRSFGDYGFQDYSSRNGATHSWTYSVLYPKKGRDPILIASIDESLAYTTISHRIKKKETVVELRRDVQGLRTLSGDLLFSILIVSAPEARLYELLAEHSRNKASLQKPITGWTSWYNYYTEISPALLKHNVDALHELKAPIDVFQIDDGWQQKIGDWELNEAFDGQMQNLVQHIKSAGFSPGLWLAPFVAEKASRLFRNKKQMLLRDASGKPVKAGFSTMWSGNFYALDIYNQELRNYLQAVFARVINVWGFDFVKLDFLYAAALVPGKGRSRGQIMFEAMSFLRTLCKDIKILACGVPLGPAFGLVDYCRIGADIHLSWEHKLLKFLRNRERVSTLLSLQNSISRHGLNKWAWGNDPDVFILRDDNHQLTEQEQHTIFVVNQVFGQLVFCSDDVSQYNRRSKRKYLSMFPFREKQIDQVREDRGLYKINFRIGKHSYLLCCNLSERERKCKLALGNDEIAIGLSSGRLRIDERSLKLRAHESQLYKIVDLRDSATEMVANDLHLFAGAASQKIVISEGTIDIEFLPDLVNETGLVWLLIEEEQLSKADLLKYTQEGKLGSRILIKMRIGE